MYSQLLNSKKILQKRKKIWNIYFRNLSNLYQTQTIPKNCNQGYHIFCILFENKRIAQNFIKYMRKNKITVKKHYTDLSTSPFSLKELRNQKICKTSKLLSENLIRLPLYNSLKLSDINHIIKTVKKYSY